MIYSILWILIYIPFYEYWYIFHSMNTDIYSILWILVIRMSMILMYTYSIILIVYMISMWLVLICIVCFELIIYRKIEETEHRSLQCLDPSSLEQCHIALPLHNPHEYLSTIHINTTSVQQLLPSEHNINGTGQHCSHWGCKYT